MSLSLRYSPTPTCSPAPIEFLHTLHHSSQGKFHRGTPEVRLLIGRDSTHGAGRARWALRSLSGIRDAARGSRNTSSHEKKDRIRHDIWIVIDVTVANLLLGIRARHLHPFQSLSRGREICRWNTHMEAHQHKALARARTVAEKKAGTASAVSCRSRQHFSTRTRSRAPFNFSCSRSP